jgi:molybdopterin biosynthesis enzyme
VQLIFPNLFGITPDAIDALADALREASENRDVIIVSGQGRNAELLTGTNG